MIRIPSFFSHSKRHRPLLSSNPDDPQKPRRDQDGPPDLDEVWKNFENSLKSFFGNKGKSSQNNSPDSDPRKPGGSPISFRLMALGAAGLVALWLLSGFYIINEGSAGVISRFGQYRTTVLSGVQWHLPYPIETVDKVNLSSVRTFSVGYRNSARNKVPKEALMLTEDENIVDLQFDVQWRIKPSLEPLEGTVMSAAGNYLFSTTDPDESVRQAAETAMREVVGRQSMNKILYESRSQAALDTRQIMQRILDRYHTGIEVITVAIQNVQPPEKVQEAFEDAIKAGQDYERQKNEGQAYASAVIPRAKGQAARMVLDAQGYEAQVVGQSKGEASRFEAVQQAYAENPDVTRQRLYIDTMKQVMSTVPAVITPSSSGKDPLMLLPMQQLMQLQGGKNGAVVPAESAAPQHDKSDSVSAEQADGQDSDRLKPRTGLPRPLRSESR